MTAWFRLYGFEGFAGRTGRVHVGNLIEQKQRLVYKFEHCSTMPRLCCLQLYRFFAFVDKFIRSIEVSSRAKAGPC